jgi:hypothetical protein
MSNKAFAILLIGVGALVALMVVMHSPQGVHLMRSMRALHGG